jgi:hypothetical protein
MAARSGALDGNQWRTGPRPVSYQFRNSTPTPTKVENERNEANATFQQSAGFSTND